MSLTEINFDGIVGPSHNYAGLSLGNIASASSNGFGEDTLHVECFNGWFDNTPFGFEEALDEKVGRWITLGVVFGGGCTNDDWD